MPAMALHDVDVAYHGDIRILQDLSLRVEQGGITGVIGPNGAGKSTALRTLFGLLKPMKGDVYVGGKCVTGIAPWSFISHGVAMVPQSRSLFNELSVDDNLRLACWTFRGDKVRVEQALERAYSRFPMLKDKRNQMAGAMSGGQQRFLELGRALVLDPKVLLLDEPTAGLDAPGRAAYMEAMVFERERGAAIVTATHDVAEASTCDRVLLVAGRIVADGPPAIVMTPENLLETFGIGLTKVGDHLVVTEHHHDH